MSSKRPNSTVRINTRLETFLIRNLGHEHEFYEQEACVEYHAGFKVNPMAKYPFKIMIICRDRFYLTDNPPKNLDRFICFDDVVDIRLDDEMTKFFGGKDKENSLHVVITYKESSSSKKRQQDELEDLRKQVVRLKKEMIYKKMLDDKFVFSELNTPRSFRSADFHDELRAAMMTPTTTSSLNADGQSAEAAAATATTSSFRSYNSDSSLMGDQFKLKLDGLTTTMTTADDDDDDDEDKNQLTNRTNKSVVHFDDDNNSNNNNQTTKTTSTTTTTMNPKYKRLLELVGKDNKGDDHLSLSLSLPLTSSRSQQITNADITKALDDHVSALDLLDFNYDEKEETRKEDEKNRRFIQDSTTEEKKLDIYFLEPKSKMFRTLKIAHFNSKIRATLNFHKEREDNSSVLKMLKKSGEMQNKFKELKAELFQNVDNLENTSKLINELLYATNTYPILKKFFWSAADFYEFIVGQVRRYLPKSSVNLSISKGRHRRLKELECCASLVECLSVMLNETEFNHTRNEIISLEKCKYLTILIDSLLAEPETGSFDHLLAEQIVQATNDLSLVSAVLFWELLSFLKMAAHWWTNKHFNFDVCVNLIDSSPYVASLVKRVIVEMELIINKIDLVVISPQQTVTFFKLVDLLRLLARNGAGKKVHDLLKQNYQEEFKYYFSEDRVKSKCFNYYPIVDDLLSTIRKLNYTLN